MAIWVIKDGHREGPYEEQDVRELIYEGTYSDIDPAIRDGQLDWTTIGQILGHQPDPPETASPSVSVPVLPALPTGLPPIEPVPAAVVDSPPELPVPPTFPASPSPVQVTVTDFQMPFGSMVLFLVKWVLAAIPALIILGAIAATFWITFFALISAALRH